MTYLPRTSDVSLKSQSGKVTCGEVVFFFKGKLFLTNPSRLQHIHSRTVDALFFFVTNIQTHHMQKKDLTACDIFQFLSLWDENITTKSVAKFPLVLYWIQT